MFPVLESDEAVEQLSLATILLDENGVLYFRRFDPFGMPLTPLVEVPVTLTVAAPFYGVSLAPDAAMTGTNATTVTYTLEVSNIGSVPDTFDLSVSGNTWMTMLSESSVSLGIGESTTVEVSVRIPALVANGSMDTATVTATSQGDGAVTDSATLVTTAVAAGPPVVYLPVFINE